MVSERGLGDRLFFQISQFVIGVRQLFEQHHGEMCTSTVTTVELLCGAHKSQSVRWNLDAAEGLLARLDVLDFDMSAAEHAGEIRAALARIGTPIGPYDIMTAGHARPQGLTLVTNNMSEFERVSGLRLENWTAPQ